MNRWTIPLDDFNASIERARRNGQTLWAAQALTRFAYSDRDAIPLRKLSSDQKKRLTFVAARRKLHA